MRRTSILAIAVILAVALPAAASTLVYFTDNTHTQLRAEFRTNEDFPDAGSECSAQTCHDRYWLERRVGPRSPIDVDRVEIDHNAAFPTLVVTLTSVPASVKDVFVVFAGMKNTAGEDLPWESIEVAPQAEADEFATDSLTYQTIEPRDLENEHPTITAVNKDTGQKITLPVKKIKKVGTSGIRHSITYDDRPLPRGMKFKTTIEGLDPYGGDALKAKTTIERAAFPEKRDDATVYANGSVEADEVGEGSRAYKLDVLIAPKWTLKSDLWEHGPKLDMIIGNKTSKAPNTATLGWELRHFIVHEVLGIASHSFTVGPQYSVDRQNENRDLKLDAEYDPLFKAFEGHTVKQRRADIDRDEGNVLDAKWGWQVRPSVGLEGGWHLESTSPDVEGNSLGRLRGTISALVERAIDVPRAPGTLRLTVTGTARKLFSDEAILDEEGKLVRTDRSDRSFLRADLSYDLGPWAITLSHLNGRQPPAFTPTHSTSFGVTVKY